MSSKGGRNAFLPSADIDISRIFWYETKDEGKKFILTMPTVPFVAFADVRIEESEGGHVGGRGDYHELSFGLLFSHELGFNFNWNRTRRQFDYCNLTSQSPRPNARPPSFQRSSAFNDVNYSLKRARRNVLEVDVDGIVMDSFEQLT